MIEATEISGKLGLRRTVPDAGKTDITEHCGHVRFVPEADIGPAPFIIEIFSLPFPTK
jgi:hypothetical protein